MSKNEGTIDRVVRVVAAVVAAALAVGVGVGTVGGVILLAVAAVLLITAAIGFCPLYRLIGVSTCPVRAGDA